MPQVEAVVPTIEIQGEHTANKKILQEIMQKKEVHFSDNVAPEHLKFKQQKESSAKTVEVGEIQNGKVTAYLHMPLISEKEFKERVTNAGFKVVQSYKIDKKGDLISIVFTNDAIVEASSKSGRGFASTLRATIDKKESLVSITNPLYHMRSFMQAEYNESLANATLRALRESFKELNNSSEELKFTLLERYQFMDGMPKYEDMQIIAKAPNAELLSKAEESKKLIYKIALQNGSTILGVELGARTSKFVNKIGHQNAGLLPYPVLIENNEAKILDPKYYIAIMYPMLKMSQFMTIATVPGAINKDIDTIFR